MKDKQKEKYYERKAAGLCVRCGKPRTGSDSKVYCPECRKEYAERNIRKYHERKAAGLCVICGKPAAEGKTRCFECGVKYGHYHKYYKKKKSQTSITEHVRNFRQKRKDAGLCVYCGRPKGPAEMTKLGCRECLDIRSEQQKQAYRKEATRFKERQRERYRKIYYERKAAGLCVRCGKPAEKGTLCKECKKKRKEVNMANYEKST